MCVSKWHHTEDFLLCISYDRTIHIVSFELISLEPFGFVKNVIWQTLALLMFISLYCEIYSFGFLVWLQSAKPYLILICLFVCNLSKKKKQYFEDFSLHRDVPTFFVLLFFIFTSQYTNIQLPKTKFTTPPFLNLYWLVYYLM